MAQSILSYSSAEVAPSSLPTVVGEIVPVIASRKVGWRQKIARHLAGFGLAGLTLLISNASVNAQAICRPVHGRIAATGLAESCPAEFCSIGRFEGAIKGDYFVATTLNSAQPDPEVVFYTGVTIATVRIGNQQGELQLKNSGVFRPTGELTELETITGGTGDFVGATGLLFVAGTSGETAGTFTYEGIVCLP